MAKLIDKLNTLVRASVQGALGGDAPERSRRGKSPSRKRRGKDIDRDIAALREQVNQALDDEDRMAAEIAAQQRQVADWDRQADAALQKGDESGARHAIRQMQLQQQRAAMVEAELAQHRFSTSELISRVNELEAVVATARQQPPSPAPDEDADDEPLSARLRQASQATVRPSLAVEPPSAAPEVVDEQAVEDDLARRRARLSQ
jgi:chromosome segregation ATPase